MISLTIGSDSREIKTKSDIDESWINHQIGGRRADGLSVCVRVTIREDNLDMILSTPGCGGGLGGGRQANPAERSMFDLWAKRGLNDPNFTGGALVAFLNQLIRH